MSNGSQAICILGMHRSGTSCLAGCLEGAGVFLGEVSHQNPHNLKGNHEHARVVQLNDRVLADNSGSWSSPPAKVVWQDEHRRERDEIIRQFSAAPNSSQRRWGFKDPRTLLTLAGWMEALPGMTLVGTFRDPIAVAESLHRRNRWPMERGIDLWLKYDLILKDLVQKRSIPLISFDLPPEQYRLRVQTLCDRLGLSHPSQAGNFFEEDLRHHDEDQTACQLAPGAADLHQFLTRAAL